MTPTEMPSTFALRDPRRLARAALAGIDGIALPLVLLPFVWAALFFHACLDRSLRRVACVTLALWIGAALALALPRTPPRSPHPLRRSRLHRLPSSHRPSNRRRIPPRP